MLIQNSSTENLTNAIKSINLTGDQLLFIMLREKGGVDVPQIIETLNKFNIDFIGGIFPGVIYGDQKYEEGAMITRLPVLGKPILITGLNARNILFPDFKDIMGKFKTKYAAMVLVDGLTENIDGFLSMLVNRLADPVHCFGGGAGSITFKQRPCIFTPRGAFQDAAMITFELSETNRALRSEITDRKKIEAGLAHEKELLSVTLHSIAEGVITTDVLGNILSINRVAEEITGWTQEEMLGEPLERIFQIVIDEKTLRICKNPLEGLLKYGKKKVVTEHIKLIDKNKTRKIICANAAPIRDKTQDLVGHVIIFRDVTEQKKFETQLAMSQKLQSIGELAAGIAHEINTPMQYIGDNTRFLQDAVHDIIYGLLDDYRRLKDIILAHKNIDLPLIDDLTKKEQELEIDYLSKEIPKAIKETLEGIEKVNKLVLAMKEFAHPGKKEKKPSDINKAIEGVETISRNEWKYVAELETDLEPGLPLVYCALDEINQVLLNMIINAVQAIREAQKNKLIKRGKIKIATRNKGNYIKILVRDNGAGIPEMVIDRIFEPFFTTKEVGKGTGQGLAIAHDIITTKHKGSIQVSSKEGKGTVFTICLPVKTGYNTG